jgi:biotin transport system substrate-specific component
MKADLMRTEAVRSTTAQKAGLVLAGIGILAASAWLSVPFYPVPLTMQTLAVLLVGGALGPALGVSAVVGYLALGALGAPVFHGRLVERSCSPDRPVATSRAFSRLCS